MRHALLSALLLAGCAGALLPAQAAESGRTFVTELTVTRGDGLVSHILQTVTQVAPAGQVVKIQVPSLAPATCAGRSTAPDCAPWSSRSLAGYIQATPAGDAGIRLNVTLTSQAGSDASTAHLFTQQATTALFQRTVVAAEVVEGQAVVYTLKISEPNEISVIK